MYKVCFLPAISHTRTYRFFVVCSRTWLSFLVLKLTCRITTWGQSERKKFSENLFAPISLAINPSCAQLYHLFKYDDYLEKYHSVLNRYVPLVKARCKLVLTVSKYQISYEYWVSRQGHRMLSWQMIWPLCLRKNHNTWKKRCVPGNIVILNHCKSTCMLIVYICCLPIVQIIPSC